MQTYRKSLQNPWLDLIKVGSKKYEGRVYMNDWTKINVGDYIIFYHGNIEIKTKVTSLIKFTNFIEAFRVLGIELMPLENVTEDLIRKIYHKEYGGIYNESDIDKFGVIAVGVKVIE